MGDRIEASSGDDVVVSEPGRAASDEIEALEAAKISVDDDEAEEEEEE